MRVLLVSFVGNNRWSGMGKWAHSMAEGLSQLGHSASIWFADDFPRIQRTGRFSVLASPLVLAIRMVREKGNFDVAVIHEPSGFWYGLLRCLSPSLPPMVLMCHNIESRCYGEIAEAAAKGLAVLSRGTRVKTPLFRLWQSDSSIRLADHVVCLSTIDRDYLVNRLNRSQSQITLQLNGVAAENFRGDPRSAGQRVLFVGGWLDVKGKRLLTKIWSEVRAKFSQAHLSIIGAGESVESVLADFPLVDRGSVTVIPHLDVEAEMTVQFTSHDLFLMPSLSEGSPLSMLEAMAVMMPVVAARVGGIPDIITHERDGLLFKSMDAKDGATQVCRLLADPGIASQLGRLGQERARSLSWAASARTLESAIEIAVARTPRDRKSSP